MKGTLDGSKGMAVETFLETLMHIKKSFCLPTKIIMANVECHLSINAVKYCSDNGIVLATLPPHTTAN